MAQAQQRKDVEQQGRTVPRPAQVQKFLGGLDDPVEKKDLLGRARREGADDDARAAIERVPDRRCDGPVSLSSEVGKLD